MAMGSASGSDFIKAMLRRINVKNSSSPGTYTSNSTDSTSGTGNAEDLEGKACWQSYRN
jgi:hypothetical protein